MYSDRKFNMHDKGVEIIVRSSKRSCYWAATGSVRSTKYSVVNTRITGEISASISNCTGIFKIVERVSNVESKRRHVKRIVPTGIALLERKNDTSTSYLMSKMQEIIRIA